MNSESIEDRLRSWLAHEGYPFELRVGRVFREVGWGVEHAQLFSDLETEKPREIDLVASTQVGDRETFSLVNISWAIECKRTSTSPWVVFVSRQREDGVPASALQMATGQLATGVMIHAEDLIPKTATFEVPSRLGHGIVRAFSNNKSGDPTAPYAALLCAASAAAALMRGKEALLLRRAGKAAIVSVHIPLVAIEGRLFEMEIDDTGQEAITEVDRSIVLVRSPGSATESVLVTIVTAANLQEFAAQLLADSRRLAAEVLPDAQHIWTDFKRLQPNNTQNS